MASTRINGGTQIQPNTVTSGQVDATIIVAAGGNAFTGDQSFGNHKATNVADPTSAQDAANKRYVDNAIQGLVQKPTARVATAAALPAGTYSNGASGVGATFTVTATGTLTVDGIVTALGDIILVKNQASALQNGLYQVTTAGAGGVAAVLTRHVDMDASTEFAGAFIAVADEGTTNKNTLWLNNYTSSFTVGTTAVTFTQLNAATGLTGSSSILVSGGVISAIFGSTSGTVCQGNDSRLSDARTPVGTALTSAQIWVGNGSNVAAAVALSGDVTITNAGVATVANQVKLSKYIVRETPSGTINGSTTAFTLANTPVAGTEQVYLNGIQQDAGAGNDYTISTNTITMLSAPLTGDKLRVTYVSQ